MQSRIGYTFKNPALMELALIHKSYSNERGCAGSYERLEFLGDAILNFLTAARLYALRPSDSEGDLTRARAALVCEKSLSEVAETLELGRFIRFGKGELQTGGAYRSSVLCDVVEAIIGAIYLDGGLEAAREFVSTHILTDEKLALSERSTDYKTRLQEVVQQKPSSVLTYRHIAEEGPEHDKTFTVEAEIDGKVLSCGKGHSKKEAEREAARLALEVLES